VDEGLLRALYDVADDEVVVASSIPAGLPSSEVVLSVGSELEVKRR
jgi:hypothetical protein